MDINQLVCQNANKDATPINKDSNQYMSAVSSGIAHREEDAPKTDRQAGRPTI